MALRNAFKNFRRHYDEKLEDEEVAGTQPPAKRLKLYTGEEADIGEDEYEEAVEELQEEHKLQQQGRKGKGHGNIKRLLEITKIRRYQWIQNEQPLISEVLEKFPHLSTNKWVLIIILYYKINIAGYFGYFLLDSKRI